jgi:hypothetical protein
VDGNHQQLLVVGHQNRLVVSHPAVFDRIRSDHGTRTQRGSDTEQRDDPIHLPSSLV